MVAVAARRDVTDVASIEPDPFVLCRVGVGSVDREEDEPSLGALAAAAAGPTLALLQRSFPPDDAPLQVIRMPRA